MSDAAVRPSTQTILLEAIEALAERAANPAFEAKDAASFAQAAASLGGTLSSLALHGLGEVR